jgi:murein DD-endopeptidase MepM/ murein hydrolase activator NlpD
MHLITRRFDMLWLLTLLASLVAPSAQAMTVTPSSRIARPGSVIVLTIATGRPVDSIHVRAFDRELLAYPAGERTWRVLVGVDLEAALGEHVVAIDSAAGSTTYRLQVTARQFRTRTLKVDDAFVNPPPDVQGRIEREAQRQQALWTHPTPEKLWTGPFVRPVPDPANSAFGTRSVLNGQPRSPHGGADFLSPAGRPVKAPNAGTVVLAEELYYTGGTVIVDHGLGLFSLFAHLSALTAHAGDRVKTGDVVGSVGATGRVTGPHLHWTVRLNGARVDPLSLLAALAGPG